MIWKMWNGLSKNLKRLDAFKSRTAEALLFSKSGNKSLVRMEMVNSLRNETHGIFTIQ